MFIWTIKLVSSVRRAIAGRKYPAQLAWAVALGAFLGLVPHGNLIALMLLLLTGTAVKFGRFGRVDASPGALDQSE